MTYIVKCDCCSGKFNNSILQLVFDNAGVITVIACTVGIYECYNMLYVKCSSIYCAACKHLV